MRRASLAGATAVVFSVTLLAGAIADPAADTSSLPYPLGSGSPDGDGPRVPNANGALPVSFRDLASFEFLPLESKVDPAVASRSIPDSIRAWSGKKVVLDGYMMPTQFDPEKGTVTEFVLMSRTFGCCEPGTPMIHEMAVVTMGKGKSTQPYPDRIVSVTGKLTVGVETDNLGYMVSIYRIRGETVQATGPVHTH